MKRVYARCGKHVHGAEPSTILEHQYALTCASYTQWQAAFTFNADEPILLFMGSRTDTSQLLTIPKALLQEPTQGDGAVRKAAPANRSTGLHLENECVQRLAAFDCPAPVHDAFAFQDPPGALPSPNNQLSPWHWMYLCLFCHMPPAPVSYTLALTIDTTSAAACTQSL